MSARKARKSRKSFNILLVCSSLQNAYQIELLIFKIKTRNILEGPTNTPDFATKYYSFDSENKTK